MWGIAGTTINCYNSLEKCLVIATNAEHNLPQSSVSLLLGMFSKEMHEIVTKRHVVECSNTLKLELPKFPSAIEWINKLWRVHKTGHSAVLRVTDLILMTSINIDKSYKHKC